MAKQLIGLDCETNDALLKDAGWSWKYGEGYILNTALYYAESDTVAVIPGKYNENCPYSKDERAMLNKTSIESILRNPNVCIVGANLQYDIGWLLYEYGMSTYEVKCSFIDVLIAEHLLDEFNIHTLDELSWKYLKYGKTKDRIETWVRENVSAKGDFRKYLKDAPWDLLCEYVTGDAKNPVNIWKKQLTLLKEQDLCSRTKLEFDCLLPILQITMNGYPIDVVQKEKNKKELEECISLLEKEFRSKYDMPTFRVTASNDIASFCDKRNIPYRCKITLKGYNGELLGEDYVKIDSAYNRAKKIVSSFQYVKSKPVVYVPKEMTERTCDLLSEEGFTYTCSPNVDKKFFDSARKEYPEIGLIADWKLAKGILSKILGEKYDRFIQQDKDGVYKVHPQFKTTDTISMRLSSVMPNGQQIPSKGGFALTVDGKEKEVSFPALTRALFKPTSDKILWKIDYGQIEYRLICNIAVGEGSKEVREEFKLNPKLDFHQYVVDLTGLSRKYAKNMSFGCFSTDSLFLTTTGWRTYKSITSDNVLDLQGNKQENKTFIFKDKGLRFTLSNGVRFTVNKEHLFLDCEKAEDVMFTKKAKDMKVGDRVPLTRLPSSGEGHLTESLAYLAGLYIGDGNGTHSSIRLLAHKENKDFVRHCLDENNFSFSVREEKNIIRFTVHKEAKDFFLFFGDRTGTKHITDDVYSSKESVRLSFLAGLLDTDGSVKKDSIRFMGTNENLIRQVALLCTTLGFDCSFNVCNREKDLKPTEYTLIVYNTNYKLIPSVYRKADVVRTKTDIKGWKLDRNGTLLQEKRANKKLYKEEPQLYEYLIREKRNCFVHNSFIPSKCWQKNFLPCEIIKIEEVEEQNFVFLTTQSKYYNAMGIATHNCSFGMGLKSMAERFGWTMERAEEISEQYNARMPFVQPTLALVGDVAKKRGYIRTVCGSHARLPNPNKSYTMLNRYTQGSGAEILKSSIVRAYKEGLWEKIHVVNTIHDELNGIISVSEDNVRSVYEMAKIMTTTVPLNVPLEAEVELGENWAETKEIKDWLEIRDNSPDKWEKLSESLKQAVLICEKLIKEGKV